MKRTVKIPVVAALIVATLVSAPFALADDETSTQAVEAQWRPTAEDAERIRTQTEAYFAILDRGDVVAAFGLYRPSFQKRTLLNDFAASFKARLPDGAAVASRRFLGVNWVVDATSGGRFAVVDYRSVLDDGGEVCGAVVWATGDQPGLFRHRSRLVPARFARWATRSEIDAALRDMGCRGIAPA